MSYRNDLTLTEAFAEYGANLRNRLCDYSAIAQDDSLVISAWGHLIEQPAKGEWRYQVDDLSTWTSNPVGSNLLKEHLDYAFNGNHPVRLVIAMPKAGAKPAVAGTDGRQKPKMIYVRKDYVGKVMAFDGNSFVIDFKKN